MNESSSSGAGNGNAGARATAGAEQVKAGAEQVKEHLRAAKDAATDTVRGASREAQSWSRSRFSEWQDRVEAEPYRAAAWALGVGFVAGVLITALARRR